MRVTLTVFLIITLLLGTALIFYAYKRRAQPGAIYFLLFVVAVLSYTAGYIGEINSSSFQTALFWSGFIHLALPLNPYFWLMLCLDYTQVIKHKKIVRNVLLVLPAAFYLIYFTNGYNHLYISEYSFLSNGFFSVIVSTKGPAYIAFVIVFTVIGAICSMIYIRRLRESARLQKISYAIMIIASFIPFIPIYLNTTSTNPLGIDYYPFAMVISGVLFMFGIFRYNIFKTIPIAIETVFRLSEDAIAISDINGLIMDMNESFLRLFPELKKLMKYQNLDDFLKSHPKLAGISYDSPSINFQMKVKEDMRYFSVQLLQITSGEGLRIGSILCLKDITLYVEYQNRLEALAATALKQAESNELSFLQAQISPHFINNTLSIIGSMISRDDEAAKNLVVDLSEYLIDCYKPSVSSPMATLKQELELVNTYTKIIKTRFGERLNFVLSTEELPDLIIPRLVLQPMVENAARHGVLPKKEGGTVWLRIFSEGRFVCFEVKDNGVGIQTERIATLLEGNDIQQGVGMINIHKRLLKYYGEGLSVKSNPEGTVVRFRIPITEGSVREAAE